MTSVHIRYCSGIHNMQGDQITDNKNFIMEKVYPSFFLASPFPPCYCQLPHNSPPPHPHPSCPTQHIHIHKFPTLITPKLRTFWGEKGCFRGRARPLGMRNLGENYVKEIVVGDLASATIGGTICQAPVSGPAPVPATVEAEFEHRGLVRGFSLRGPGHSSAADHSFWGDDR